MQVLYYNWCKLIINQGNKQKNLPTWLATKNQISPNNFRSSSKESKSSKIKMRKSSTGSGRPIPSKRKTLTLDSSPLVFQHRCTINLPLIMKTNQTTAAAICHKKLFMKETSSIKTTGIVLTNLNTTTKPTTTPIIDIGKIKIINSLTRKSLDTVIKNWQKDRNNS